MPTPALLLASVVVTLALALAPSRGRAQVPAADRPAVTVTSFDFGTVASQLNGDAHARRRLEHAGIHDPAAFVQALGVGLADLVTEKLVESERFRVFERRQLEAVKQEQELDVAGDEITRARYVVTGSISWLGLNNKDYGGIAGAMSPGRLLGRMAAASVRHSTTSLHVTARVVDTRTGEIIGSFTSQGQSNRRWGVSAFSLGPGGFGGARAADTDFRETAIGEAAARAATDIAERLIAMRAGRLRP